MTKKIFYSLLLVATQLSAIPLGTDTRTSDGEMLIRAEKFMEDVMWHPYYQFTPGKALPRIDNYLRNAREYVRRLGSFNSTSPGLNREAARLRAEFIAYVNYVEQYKLYQDSKDNKLAVIDFKNALHVWIEALLKYEEEDYISIYAQHLKTIESSLQNRYTELDKLDEKRFSPYEPIEMNEGNELDSSLDSQIRFESKIADGFKTPIRAPSRRSSSGASAGGSSMGFQSLESSLARTP